MILKNSLKKLKFYIIFIKNMKLNALLISIISLLIVLFSSYYLTKSDVSCVVLNAEQDVINGFYEGYGGIYMKKVFNSKYLPDIFSLIQVKRSSSYYIISFAKRMWTINDLSKHITLYINQPEHPEDYIYQPPKLGWMNPIDQMKKSSSIIVTNCIGSLENSVHMNNANENDNLHQLLQRPITTLLLIIIFSVAYYLWAYRIDVSEVAYSYDMFYLQGEYWRGVTASFSHFDLLHLAFNTMALYQLGILEFEYGSISFLYLNMDLVVITMILCTVIYHILITKYGRTDMINQQAIGFSCVLFAWMVALSVRLEEYCPIFILPSFCIHTWLIPLPTMIANTLHIPGFPVNLGPFVLLFVTKLIMPRSSLIGHLSGIIIGYPLGWNLLNWLTPPLLLSSLTLYYIISQQWYVWRYPGFVSDNIDFESFISSPLIRNHKILHVLAYIIVVLTPVMIFFMGFEQILLRLIESFLVLSTVYACQIEWFVTILTTKEQCNRIMLLTVLYLLLCTSYDLCTLLSWFTAKDILLYSGTSNSLSYWYIEYATQALGILTVIEIVSIYLIMIRLLDPLHSSALHLLSIFRCDSSSINQDLKTLGIVTCYTNSTSVVAPFSGVGHRLSTTTSSSEQNSSYRNDTQQIYV